MLHDPTPPIMQPLLSEGRSIPASDSKLFSEWNFNSSGSHQNFGSRYHLTSLLRNSQGPKLEVPAGEAEAPRGEAEQSLLPWVACRDRWAQACGLEPMHTWPQCFWLVRGKM